MLPSHTSSSRKLSLSSVFCCRAGSGYPNGYPVLGNSRCGFPLPSSRFAITYCDQSFPSPWHCLSVAPSWCYPLVHSRGLSSVCNLGTRVVAVVPQPPANLSHQQTPPHYQSGVNTATGVNQDLCLEEAAAARGSGLSSVNSCVYAYRHLPTKTLTYIYRTHTAVLRLSGFCPGQTG